MAPEETTKLTHRLARGASIYLAGLFFGKLMTLGLQLLLARALGSAGYGLYSLGYSVLMVVLWIASLGADVGVLRFCALYRGAEKSEEAKGILRIGVGLGLVSSFIVAGLLAANATLLASHVFSEPRGAQVIRWFAFALPAYVLMRTTGKFAQSRQDMYRMTMILQVQQPTLILLFVLVAFALGFGLEGAVGSFLAATVVSAALGLHYVMRVYPDFFSSLQARTDLKVLLRYSVTLTVAGVMHQLILRSSNVLLGYWTDARQIGLYSAGASLSVVMAVAPSVFAQPFLPMMVQLFEQKRFDELRRLYITATRWTSSLLLPFCLVICLFSEEIMGMFGHDFRAATPVVIPLTLAWLIYFCKGPGAGLLEMTGRQTLDLLNLVGAAVIVIVLDVLLIPRYGAIGAAMGTAGGIIAWAVAEFIEVWLLYSIVPWNWLIVRQLVAVGLAGGVGFLVRPYLPWPVAATATGGTCGVLFLLFCVAKEDREFLNRILARIREWSVRASPTPEEG